MVIRLLSSAFDPLDRVSTIALMLKAYLIALAFGCCVCEPVGSLSLKFFQNSSPGTTFLQEVWPNVFITIG